MPGNAARVAHPNVVPFDVRACPERSRRGGIPQLCRAWASSTTSLEAFSLSEPVHVPQGAVPRAAQVAEPHAAQAASAALRVAALCVAQEAAAVLRVPVPCAAQAVSAALPVAVPCAAQVAGTHA
jgi:hypothetical protein